MELADDEDPESGEVSEDLRSPTAVACFARSTSGDRLFAGCLDREVLVWSPPDTEPVWEATAHAGTVRSVCLDREDLLVFTGGDDETVHLLDSSGGIELWSDGFTIWGARFSRDRSLLAPVAFGGSNGVLRITPPVGLTRSRPRSAGPTPGTLTWSPDGTILFTASEPALQAWDVRGRPVGDWNIPEVDPLGCDGAFL
jgi:WD40 repeat protein